MNPLDSLDFLSGRHNCVHISFLQDGLRRTTDRICDLANSQGLSTESVTPAIPRTGMKGRFFPDCPTSWLARNGKIPKTKAQEIIEQFGMSTASMKHLLHTHARPTRVLLGVALVLAKGPDVLLYNNEGSCPEFTTNLHKHLTKHAENASLVFIQNCVRTERLVCPESAHCIEIDNSSLIRNSSL